MRLELLLSIKFLASSRVDMVVGEVHFEQEENYQDYCSKEISSIQH